MTPPAHHPLRRPSLPRFALVTLVALVTLGLAACGGPAAEPASAEVWYCPMHPTYVSDHPGTCPICNMDLVKREPGEAAATAAEAGNAAGKGAAQPEHAAVALSGEGVRLAGVRTEAAERAELVTTIRTVGRVVPDETRLHRATTKIGGWVESLAVDFEGKQVRRGQPMLALYSPELLASQQEYLVALDNAARFAGSSIPEVRRGGDDLVAAARRRLELFDVPEPFLVRLAETRQASRTVTLTAPAGGFVVDKKVVAGDRVEPGMELYTVVDLSRVWIEADFYEAEASRLAVGREATLRLPYDPAFERLARIDYVYPQLDAEARTLRVRFTLANPEMKLRPGMFVDVLLDQSLGEGIVVPDSSVLDSGRRQIVFVETAPGAFEPREVRVLAREGGRARLAEGAVAAGERVAVKANFLLDSESRLRAALAAMEQEGASAETPAAAASGHAHGEPR